MIVDMKETPQREQTPEDCAIRAIVADDHEAARTRIREMLEDMGVDVVAEIANGDLLLDAVQQYHPQLVTVDVRMPGINGLVATQLIKRSFPEIRVFVITNYPNEHYRRASENMGADAFISKPEAFKGLMEAVTMWFGAPPGEEAPLE